MNQRQLQIRDILLFFTIGVDPSGRAVIVNVNYQPSSDAGSIGYLSGNFSVGRDEATQLWLQLEALIGVFQTYAPGGELTFHGDTVSFGGLIQSVSVDQVGSTLHVQVKNSSFEVRVKHEDLSASQRQLFENVLQSIRSLAWQDLRTALGAAPRTARDAVFISYRKVTEYERFAEAVATRLHQEGLRPWFDKWEMVAGDSLPGKIEEAFEQSVAFVPILTKDYREGNWATQELENALAKRSTEGYRIVPILYEDCTIPELLKATVHVNCRDHSEEAFERQMRELVEGIYRLTRNPYR